MNKLAFQQVAELPEPTWPDGPHPQMIHMDMTVPTVGELNAQHARALALAPDCFTTAATIQKSRYASTPTPPGIPSASSGGARSGVIH